MILINTVNEKYFELDGIRHAKIYQPLAQPIGSEAIGIYSIYDTRKQLVNSSKYFEFQIDGVVYASQALTIAAMLPVIWSGVSDYDVEQLEGRVQNLEENQVTGVQVYSTYAELPAAGTLLVSYKVSNDPNTALNGYYHWSGSAYVKDEDTIASFAFVRNIRRETQFQIFSQNASSGDIDIEFRGTDAIITLTGDLLIHLAYNPAGATTNIFARIIQTGTKTITVPANKSLYLDIEDALNSKGGTIPDSAYTMAADVATSVMVDEYPTDKILMFSNWGGSFNGSKGMFKDFFIQKRALLFDPDTNYADEDFVFAKRRETQFQILINTGGSIDVTYDGSGNASIDLNGDLILFTAYKVPTSSFSYTRLVTAGNTKNILLPKGNSLYLDIATALSNGNSSAMPDAAFVQIGALEPYPTDKVLLLSNWAEELKGASGLISEYILRQQAAEAITQATVETTVIDSGREKLKLPLNYHKLHERMKPFIQSFMNESKDIEIVLLGDSILGRSVNNTALSTAEQQSRPPMMISKNIASGIWDKIDNGNIQHSRWDKAGIFTETGASWTSYFGETLKAAWDDAGDRAGETREFLGTGTASVAFDFLADNRRLNFIYRTSTEGNAALTVAITAGNGVVEVWNGSAWIEANGFSFSQLYTGSGTGYGNTEYQRRLKFRKVTAEITNLHEITISKAATGSAESLMYWGIEQTNRDFIVSVRNVARGGHDMQTLWNYIRTEFDNFDTDFVLFELPIINMKMYAETPSYFWTSSLRGVYPKLLDGSNANSLKSISNSFADFQVLPMLLNETIAWVNADGTLKDFDRGGTLYNSDSYFNYLSSKFWEYDNEIGFVNIWRWLKENSIETFGDLYTSMINTTKDSRDSYAYNVHPNDYGVENLLLYILPIFDFNIS